MLTWKASGFWPDSHLNKLYSIMNKRRGIVPGPAGCIGVVPIGASTSGIPNSADVASLVPS